jgi:hypothetical protein
LEGRGRTLVTTIVVGLILIVPLVLLFAGSGGGDDDKAEATPDGSMRVERFSQAGFTELVVSVDPAANVPERAGGARSVRLECLDTDDQPVIAQDEAWPFTDTDGDTINPHTHVTLDPNQLEQVSTCSLVGTDPPLAAVLP